MRDIHNFARTPNIAMKIFDNRRESITCESIRKTTTVLGRIVAISSHSVPLPSGENCKQTRMHVCCVCVAQSDVIERTHKHTHLTILECFPIHIYTASIISHMTATRKTWQPRKSAERSSTSRDRRAQVRRRRRRRPQFNRQTKNQPHRDARTEGECIASCAAQVLKIHRKCCACASMNRISNITFNNVCSPHNNMSGGKRVVVHRQIHSNQRDV